MKRTSKTISATKRRRNVIAAGLRDPKFKEQVVQSKKVYSRDTDEVTEAYLQYHAPQGEDE